MNWGKLHPPLHKAAHWLYSKSHRGLQSSFLSHRFILDFALYSSFFNSSQPSLWSRVPSILICYRFSLWSRWNTLILWNVSHLVVRSYSHVFIEYSNWNSPFRRGKSIKYHSEKVMNSYWTPIMCQSFHLSLCSVFFILFCKEVWNNFC